MTARLLHYRNESFETFHDLGSGICIVGRSPSCDVAIDSPTISRRHFSLTVDDDGGIKLQDLDSENGTYVNGVREYVRDLTSKTTIQAGSEMFLFMPSGAEHEEPPGAGHSADRTKASDGTEPKPTAETSSIAPVLLRRMQAEMRIRVRPHFILREEKKSERVFAIGPGVNPIGLGNLKISLGPSKTSATTIFAEVSEESNGSHQIRAKALFSRIRINGKVLAKARLKPGDEVLIGSQVLVYHPGLESKY